MRVGLRDGFVAGAGAGAGAGAMSSCSKRNISSDLNMRRVKCGGTIVGIGSAPSAGSDLGISPRGGMSLIGPTVYKYLAQ